MHDLTSEVVLLSLHDIMPSRFIRSISSVPLDWKMRFETIRRVPFYVLVPHNCFGEQQCESDGLAFNIIIIMHINEIRNPFKWQNLLIIKYICARQRPLSVYRLHAYLKK